MRYIKNERSLTLLVFRVFINCGRADIIVKRPASKPTNSTKTLTESLLINKHSKKHNKQPKHYENSGN